VTVVDSSVWIDLFRGQATPETERLNQLAGVAPLVSGDLIFAEVLQGIDNDHEFELVRSRLSSLIVVRMGGLAVAVQSARNFRKLRSLGVTVRKTMDNIIATFCILNGYDLLYSDRDFDPFVKHLGLRSAMSGI
jgi:predicted nucleic acid-binding protein